MRLQVGQWILNEHENQLTNSSNANTIKLEPRAMAVLVYIAHNSDRVISRDELIEKIWDGRIVSDHAIYRVITQIRKALGSDDSGEYLKTISKKGYKLVQPVKVFEEAKPETQTVAESKPNQQEEVPNDEQYLKKKARSRALSRSLLK